MPKSSDRDTTQRSSEGRAMRAKELILRCYMVRREDYFFASCIDLGLGVQADSAEEAKKKLEQQIHSYIEEALTVDREYASQLLTRKAAMSERLLYSWLQFRNWCSGTKPRNGSGVGKAFEEPMPLRLA